MNRLTDQIAFSVFLVLLVHFGGCACSCESCGSETGSAGPAAVVRNFSDVEFLIERVEQKGDRDYLLTGKVLSARTRGGTPGMAEPGQKLTLRPAFPAGESVPADAGLRRLIGLRSAREGERIRCRITLAHDGTWRILSVE